VEFAVVGAGLLGLSTARALRKRGRDVVLYERSTVGNERSGSKGSSRIFRLGYTDPRYVTMAIEAQAHWRDLEDEAGQPLLDPTGQVSFGASGTGVVVVVVVDGDGAAGLAQPATTSGPDAMPANRRTRKFVPKERNDVSENRYGSIRVRS